jgi:integrase
VAGHRHVAFAAGRQPGQERCGLLEPEQPAIDAVRNPSARDAICRAGEQDCAVDGDETRKPHTIRHTTAVHLLRAGVDINTIRAWLGHVSLDTTHVYAEVDMEMKAKALARVDISGVQTKPWQRPLPSLMTFLKAL